MAGNHSAVKVHIDHVVKKFNGRNGEMVALNGVDMDIHENEFICVVGPSGCGKSTLLNIIGGLETPTEGKVLVDGAEVTGPGPDRGIVFQQYALFPWLTVEKNVQFGLKLQGKSKEEAEELLDFLRNKSERLFVYTGLVYTWADSLEELDRRVQQVTSVAQGCTIGLEPLHFRQRQALNSVLPLGDNHVTVSRYLTTGQVAMQMPFASQSLDEAGGGYYGQSKESGNLVLCLSLIHISEPTRPY